MGDKNIPLAELRHPDWKFPRDGAHGISPDKIGGLLKAKRSGWSCGCF